MDILGLYDEDLSLFSGDLLVGLAPATESDFGQDGLKLGQTALLGQTGLGLEQTDGGLSDPLTETSWLDTKVDLLDYITAGVVTTDIQEMPAAPDLAITSLVTAHPTLGVTLPTDNSTTAIQVLQNVAEETVSMLTSGEMATIKDEEPVDDISTGMDILEMLAHGMGANLEDITMDVTPEVDYSPILSPVTPEDVDTILSSGPPSPEVSDLSLLSTTDSSFVDASFNSNDNELITVDLEQLLMQVQGQQQQLMDSSLEELEDPTYMPDMDEVSKPKSRAKPYERKVKKDTAISKPSKEAKQLERKLRKKQQNKDAATRYRQKKKVESDIINDECDQLESRNTELRGKVDQMTREISYLKNLLAEVYEAKGLLKKSK